MGIVTAILFLRKSVSKTSTFRDDHTVVMVLVLAHVTSKPSGFLLSTFIPLTSVVDFVVIAGDCFFP